jgi:CheY-like chemotaxis protein
MTTRSKNQANRRIAKILVADDSPDVTFVVSTALSDAGFEVVCASSSAEALELLDEVNDIDLVLSDVRMPGVDGFDLLRVLKHRYPSMPVILMTGAAITDDDFVPFGAAIIRKPIDIGELQRIVLQRTKKQHPS